jgi:sialic acid synthase SpsE
MARELRDPIVIGSRRVGTGQPCFVVAEIGSNHSMSLSMAKDLIRVAGKAGADAVKFQSQKLEEQYVVERESSEFIDFFRKTELPEDWYPELAGEAAKWGVVFFSSPTYLRAVDLLEGAGVPVFKIASPQAATDPILIERVARTGKPMIISTGMVTYDGVTEAIRICSEAGNDQIAVLHCISKYPTPPAEANLRLMLTYRAMFGCPVGFSDHTEGHHVAVAAVALGASVLEKHITLDRRLPGPDHAFAMEPAEFATMVRLVRDVEASLGSGVRLDLPGDLRAFVDRITMRLVAAHDIAAGVAVSAGSFVHRRTREGIPVADLARLDGAVALGPIPAGTPVGWDQLRLRRDGPSRSG